MWAVAWNVQCGTERDGERGRVSCGMECGTVRDGERVRAWAVAWNVERNVEWCAMGNEVERGLWHGMWNGA